MEVAVGIADAGGIASLSMRTLAHALGVTAMSLYYHLKNKDELLDSMVEFVYSEIALPAPSIDTGIDTGWKAAMQERADSTREVLGRHPWAISMIDERTTQGTMKHLNAMIGILRAAGLSVTMAAHAMSLVDSYVHGFALQEASLPLDESGSVSEVTEDIMAGQDMMADFPHLAEMAVELVLQPGYAYGNEFAFGIRLILDGIEAASVA